LTTTRPPAAASFAQITAISVLNVSAIYAIRPMVSYRALQLGAGPVEIGLVASSYALLSLLTAVFVGRWVDRFGAGRFLMIGATLCALSALGAIFIESIAVLAVGQALLGLGQIMNLVAAQTTIANGTTRAQRDERFGWYGVAASSGQLIGPGAAGIIAGQSISSAGGGGFDPAPVFGFAAALAFAAACQGAYLWYRAPAGSAGASGSAPIGHLSAARQVLSRPSIKQAMLASVAVILTNDMLVAYLPVFGEEANLPVELVGGLLAVRAAGSMASRLFMGRLIQALGRGHVLLGSMALAGVGMAILPFLRDPVILIGLMLVTGVGMGIGQPMTIAWVANSVTRDLRGTALAVRLTGNRLAQLLIPSVMGALAGATSVAAIFWVLAGGLLAGAGMVSRTPLDDPTPTRQTPPADNLLGGAE
jgi:MFS family permease